MYCSISDREKREKNTALNGSSLLIPLPEPHLDHMTSRVNAGKNERKTRDISDIITRGNESSNKAQKLNAPANGLAIML